MEAFPAQKGGLKSGGTMPKSSTRRNVTEAGIGRILQGITGQLGYGTQMQHRAREPVFQKWLYESRSSAISLPEASLKVGAEPD